jgi:hypothetical protein
MNISGQPLLVALLFIGLGTKEYICAIFLGTEEYTKTKECMLFSYSACTPESQVTGYGPKNLDTTSSL